MTYSYVRDAAKRGIDPLDFEKSSEIEEIREAIRRICADFPDEYWREKDDAHEFPWEFYEKMAGGGWIGIAIPESFGGGGRGITEASVILEEIAAKNYPIAENQIQNSPDSEVTKQGKYNEN